MHSLSLGGSFLIGVAKLTPPTLILASGTASLKQAGLQDANLKACAADSWQRVAPVFTAWRLTRSSLEEAGLVRVCLLQILGDFPAVIHTLTILVLVHNDWHLCNGSICQRSHIHGSSTAPHVPSRYLPLLHSGA